MTWGDARDLERDVREAAPLESESAARARMTPQESAEDMAFAVARRNAERAAWKAVWTRYCKRCEGAGWQTFVGGVDDEAEIEAELCDHCTGRNRCPRCAAALARSLACPCGWSINDPTTAMPAELFDWGSEFRDTAFTDPFSGEVPPIGG